MQEKTDTELIHIRLPKAMVKGIDHLAVDEELYRQGAIERLLAFALATAKRTGRIPEVAM